MLFFSETHMYEFTRTNIDIFTAVRTSSSTCLFLYSTPITTCADIQYDCLLHSTDIHVRLACNCYTRVKWY